MKKLFIKNYTTEIPVEKTIGEIQKLLSENGAKGIYFDYADNGVLKAVLFNIEYNGQKLSFKLPAKVEAAYKALFTGFGQEWKYKEQRMQKASMVAWRVCKLWVEAQITHVNLNQAELVEVFLPYMMVSQEKTLFEGMRDTKFQLESPKNS